MIEHFLNNSITEEDTWQYSIVDILKFRATATPEQKAYIFLPDGEEEELVLTYTQLDIHAKNIAGKLLENNRKGDRALMLFQPGQEFVKALYGCFYAGIIAVPAYSPRKNRSLSRIINIVNDCSASVILSTNEIFNNVERNFAGVSELKDLRWILTDRVVAEPLKNVTLPAPAPEDVALLQYTSGSTGNPKGVMVTHRNIIRNVDFIRQSFELSAKSVSVSWLPSFHDMGLIDGVIGPVYNGYTGILMPPVAFLQKPIRWLRAISKYKGTLGGGPNFGFDLCTDKLDKEEAHSIDLSSIRSLYNGAEPVRKSTLEKFTETFKPYGFKPEMFYPCYGMAETTLIITGGKVSGKPVYLHLNTKKFEKNKVRIINEHDKNPTSLVGVGFPWTDTKVVIVNPETFKRCSEDEIGEIWVSGSIVTKGYWNKPQVTKETFDAHIAGSGEGPFLRTGDLGFFHKNELFITGRLKDLIIIRGRNYYPQDIELAAENSHPALRANCSAAFSIDVEGEEQLALVAEVERTWLRELNVDEVCSAIRQAISEEFELEVYAVKLLRTASVLKTSSGKIQRRANKEGYLKDTLEVVGSSVLKVDKTSPSFSGSYNLISVQAWLMAWISKKINLPIEKIDPSKPVTSYGLSSMKAVELQQQFKKSFGINFPPYLFFEKISITELAEKAMELIEERR